MAGGLFSRLKVWALGETVKQPDLNNEFNNIIQNFSPDKMASFSSTLSQMQLTVNPGAIGSEHLAASTAEEIEELRYMLNQIIGGAQWYSIPSATMAQLFTLINAINAVPANRIVSGRINSNNQPMFLVPAGNAASVTLKAASTNLSLVFGGVSTTFAADITVTGLSLASGSNNTAVVTDAEASTIVGQAQTRTLGERNSTIPIGTIGSGIVALDGLLAGFKVVDGANTEYFIAEVDNTNKVLKNAYRGFFFDSIDAWKARTVLNQSDTITLMKIAWGFATFNSSVAALDICYNRPTVSSTQPTSPATGDYWYDLINTVWKKYSGSIWVIQSAVPVGIMLMDSSNCVACRSFDFYKPYSTTNSIELERISSSSVRSKSLGAKVAVYGTVFNYDTDYVSWSLPTDFDSDGTTGAGRTYYYYITDKGGHQVTDVAPHDRKSSLGGFYHPCKPWRYVGDVPATGTSAVDKMTSVGEGSRLYGSGMIINMTVVPTVGSNALTLQLLAANGSELSEHNKGYVVFSAPTGDTFQNFYVREVTYSQTIVVPSSATLGHTSGNNEFVYVYLIDNGMTAELAVSGARIAQDYGTQTTVAITSGSTSRSVMYSKAILTGAGFTPFLKIMSNQSSAGTWASVPTSRTVGSVRRLDGKTVFVYGNGGTNHGSSSTKIRRLGITTTTYTDGVDNLFTLTDSATLGSSITILKDGIYAMTYNDAFSGGVGSFGLDINTSGADLTTSISSLSPQSKILCMTAAVSGNNGTCSFTGAFNVGDVIKPHDNGSADGSGSMLPQFSICRIGDI